MPVYMLYGFRWPRAGFTGIRVYIVLHNLEEATAEYLQQPLTTSLLLESFKKTEPSIVDRLPEMRFIEQYDPEDTSDEAVSKPYAYVGAKVISIPEAGGTPCPETSWTPEDLFSGNPLDEAATEALTEMRDKYASGERIGWYIVYNGDPERWFPPDEDEDDGEEVEGEYLDGEYESDQTQTPPATPSATMRLPERFTRLFGRTSV
ncbi:AorFlbE [Aspergillus ellipticus CBS 707.79]|uniref:AorFlbE n=1 Tax=Aspergillus ellipticus CBS 707.79 TaxID=1448320 RepID=A0A319DQ61_9EURO|nr:AorFlbE [Aspergillus ellipticus CBS 707.79]